MRSTARELAYATLAWLVPFATSVCIYPLKRYHPPLFESLMGVALAGSTVLLAAFYLRRGRASPILMGVRAGVIWVIANWALDALMFGGGPMKMTLRQYMGDIGLAYFMIPAITIGMGFALSRDSRCRGNRALPPAHDAAAA